jgi:hypothetical protein
MNISAKKSRPPNGVNHIQEELVMGTTNIISNVPNVMSGECWPYPSGAPEFTPGF